MSDLANLFTEAGTTNSGEQSFLERLGQVGLSSLAKFIDQQYKDNVPFDQIWLNVEETPEYQQRFPAMKALQKAGVPFNEQLYTDWEKTATQALHQAGITDPKFYSTDYLSKYIAGNVSADEFVAKVQLASQAAQQPNDFRDQIESFYGPQPNGDYAAFFLDPEHALPRLQTQFTSSQIAMRAKQSGFGQLQVGQAEDLSQNGVTDTQAQAGFAKIAKDNELYSNIAGESGDALGSDTALEAEFKGNVYAQQRIENKRGSRKSGFGNGATYAENVRGAAGIGVARS